MDIDDNWEVFYCNKTSCNYVAGDKPYKVNETDLLTIKSALKKGERLAAENFTKHLIVHRKVKNLT